MASRTIIRKRETCRRTGLSPSTLWRYERDRNFPQRVKISEYAVGYFEDEVDEWIRQRIRGSSYVVRRKKGSRIIDGQLVGPEEIAADAAT